MNNLPPSAYKEIFKDYRCCIIIPTYNNDQTLEFIIKDLLNYTNQLVLVNDGSTDHTDQILKSYPELMVISNPVKKGKGYSLRKGFEYALSKGFQYAITIDSDGQHQPSDIPLFLEKLKKEPEAIIIGSRNMIGEGIPGKSSFGHKFSNFWFKFETDIELPDTQSGFRLYPLFLLKDFRFYTNKYEFEVEIIVRASWHEIKIVPVPINIIYFPKETRISHFRPFRDFSRVSVLNTILVLIAVFYIKPRNLFRKLTKENIRTFISENIIKSKDSNLKITLSLMFGVFMGILPIWGWQILLAIFFAFILKLNKLIVIVFANISLPPMIPFVIYFSYLTGGIILGTNNIPSYFSHSFSLLSIKDHLFQYIIGSFCLAIALSITSGIICYLLLKIFRKEPNRVA